MKPRWPSVSSGARSRGSYGKIEDCEQSTGQSNEDFLTCSFKLMAFSLETLQFSRPGAPFKTKKGH